MHDNLVALKVYEHIAGDGLRDGGDAIGAGAKGALDHERGAPEGLHSLEDADVVSRHQRLCNSRHGLHVFIHVLNKRLAC